MSADRLRSDIGLREFKGAHHRILHARDFKFNLAELDAEELAHTHKRKVERDRLQSGAAIALAHHLGVARVRHDKKGRPVILEGDLSLSHKDGIVAAGVAPKGFCIGIDVENPVAIAEPSRFAKRVLAPSEKLDIFTKAWSVDETTAIATLWSLKESFYKATGIDPGPSKTEFSLDGKITAGGRVFNIAESLVHFENSRVLTALIFARI